MHRSRIFSRLGALALAGGIITTVSDASHAASHREAPLMTLDPAADISDVYAFVSYDAANLARPAAERTATLIVSVVPGQLAIVAVFVPLAWLGRESWLYRRVALGGGSLVAAALAVFWLAERSLG